MIQVDSAKLLAWITQRKLVPNGFLQQLAPSQRLLQQLLRKHSHPLLAPLAALQEPSFSQLSELIRQLENSQEGSSRDFLGRFKSEVIRDFTSLKQIMQKKQLTLASNSYSFSDLLNFQITSLTKAILAKKSQSNLLRLRIAKLKESERRYNQLYKADQERGMQERMGLLVKKLEQASNLIQQIGPLLAGYQENCKKQGLTISRSQILRVLSCRGDVLWSSLGREQCCVTDYKELVQGRDEFELDQSGEMREVKRQVSVLMKKECIDELQIELAELQEFWQFFDQNNDMLQTRTLLKQLTLLLAQHEFKTLLRLASSADSRSDYEQSLLIHKNNAQRARSSLRSSERRAEEVQGQIRVEEEEMAGLRQRLRRLLSEVQREIKVKAKSQVRLVGQVRRYVSDVIP